MVPGWLQRVATPLVWREWNLELSDHLDPVFQSYILNGVRNGFCIGFDRGVQCVPAAANMHSALDNAEVVHEYLKKEVSVGCVLGPDSPDRAPGGTQLSPFGVILKSNQPGKWCLIVVLSSPDGRSVNDGIEAISVPCTYTRSWIALYQSDLTLSEILHAVLQV